MDLLEQHASVLFDLDGVGDLLVINEPDGGPAPRVFLARGRESARLWVRAGMPRRTAQAARGWVGQLAPWDGQPSPASDHAGLRSLLADDGPLTVESAGPAYLFDEAVVPPAIAEAELIDRQSANLLDRHFPYTRSVLAARTPVLVVVRDGAAVSACFTARRRGVACEAGVATEDAYRGQGLGTAVVAAWRDAVRASGGTPLYSTSWDNLASRGVAARLRLIPYAETLSLG